jgi:hypothetical protein
LTKPSLSWRMRAMERRLYALLTVGSHLFGTTTEESDLDRLELLIPSTEEMVDMRARPNLPQCIRNGIDTRQMFLGNFVMSLGTNVENMVVAYHYAELFEDIQTLWLNGRALRNILAAAENMWDNAKTPKNKAHAYRYTLAAIQMSQGRVLYPMEANFHENYMGLRNDDPDQIGEYHFKKYLDTVREAIKRNWPSDGYPNREKLAEWVMLRYLNLAR